ncbi:MAG: hypothetical protein FWH32_00265 [Clostridiales bacterium]|nr:hypothetical protein [Clostridiales bacterium]
MIQSHASIANYVPDELVGAFGSEAQAESAAGVYGIKLAYFANSVAIFKCEGDPKALIELGKRNGWPELSLNYVYKAF